MPITVDMAFHSSSPLTLWWQKVLFAMAFAIESTFLYTVNNWPGGNMIGIGLKRERCRRAHHRANIVCICACMCKCCKSVVLSIFNDETRTHIHQMKYKCASYTIGINSDWPNEKVKYN